MHIYLYVILLFFYSSNIQSDDLARADTHGPISLSGEHFHYKGQVMFSYKFGHMEMDDIINGTKSLTTSEVMSSPNGASDGSGTYMNAPIVMKMDVHMLGAMYAPAEFITFMTMINYVEKEMTQQRMKMNGSARFDTNSSGFGDTKIMGLIKILNSNDRKSHIGIGLSLPTGSIDKRGNTPASANTRLGYEMQNGTGNLEPILSFTNINNYKKFKFGQQFTYKQSLFGKNSKGYKHGKRINSSFWTSYLWQKNVSTALKLDYNYKGKMFGSDNEMNKRMSPAMDSYNQGYQKVNLSLSLNFINHQRVLKNHRLGIEGIIPIIKKYQGFQMVDNFRIIIGWQYGF